MATHIHSTRLTEVRPVGSAPQRSVERLVALVRQHVSAEAARIFAEPIAVADGSAVDWYVESDGEVVRLADLSDAEAAKVRSDLAERLDAIRDAATALAEGRDQRQRNAAETLQNATIFPGDDHVFAVRSGGALEPVVTGWGFEAQDTTQQQAFKVSAFGPLNPARDARRAQRAAAAPTATASPAGRSNERTAPSSTPPAPQAVYSVPAAPTRRRGIGWVLPLLAALGLLLLVAIIVALLLPACGLRTPFGTVALGLPTDQRCAVRLAAVREVTPEEAASRDLEHEFAVLAQEFARRRYACAVDVAERAVARAERAEADLAAIPDPVEPATAAEPTEPTEPDAFDQRIDRRGQSQITLIWNTTDDLDLWVRCPGGQMIRYNSRRNCSGFLDVDRNAGTSNVTTQPVENVTFEQGMPPGTYEVIVDPYAIRGPRAEVPFQLKIRRGEDIVVREGVARRGQPRFVERITQ